MDENVSVFLINKNLLTFRFQGKRRLMHSPFILMVFAAHLNGIAGAIDIEELEVAGLPAGGSSTQMYPPWGALALIAAAVSIRPIPVVTHIKLFPKVERVLQFWANGETKVPTTAPTKRRSKKPYMRPAPKPNPATGNASTSNSDY